MTAEAWSSIFCERVRYVCDHVFCFLLQREDGFFHKTKVQHTSFTGWWRMSARLWLNMKYLSNYSWSTTLSLPRTQAGGETLRWCWRLEDFGFSEVFVRLFLQTQTQQTHTYRRQHNYSFPFWRSCLSWGNRNSSCRVTSVVCAHKKAGRREQKSVWTNSLYCNLFYSTFPWRKEKLPAF